MIRLLVNFLETVEYFFYRTRLYPRLCWRQLLASHFAYTSVLHLYETMGWWRKAD